MVVSVAAPKSLPTIGCLVVKRVGRGPREGLILLRLGAKILYVCELMGNSVRIVFLLVALWLGRGESNIYG